ncbi:acyl-CoA reductase-like NAD-dependent aldehyde dehydrogenase [Kitasatospora sp. GP30]|uniref:aldehyde dehydrogenase family protein n=1 Tax=Kitasatospora sp. GP30 TaxID=3035084 RepID=UPI000CBB9038|nr:aldehyde dehydrogenase family protein [Kitasatospora sp. GP30]MDH6140349.1 acyl-CoA reductase-like NAD-dependent aldehyde dehydrogenase [Kitasatospora sp. GP30]
MATETTSDTRLIPLFRRGRWYESLDAQEVPGRAGWRLSLAPAVMAKGDAAHSQRSAAGRAALPLDARGHVLAAAVELFATGEVQLGPLGTQSATDFHEQLRATVGLPTPLTDRWTAMLRQQLDEATAAATGGAGPAATYRRTLVALPANTFTCLAAVIQAVLDSEEVWIRPSRREPISALRFAAALLQAGWPSDRLGFYPTAPDVLPALIDLTDRQVVFGGDQISERLSGLADLDLRGPGRGLALVPAGADPRERADWLLPLLAADSGRFCKNVCTVLCEDDPEPLARELAARLDAIRLDPADPALPQAAQVDPAHARALARSIEERLSPADRVLTSRPLVHEGEHGTFLAPALVLLDDPGSPDRPHPLLAYEVPFPFASICRTDPALTATTHDGSLFVYRMPDPAPAPGGAA